MHGRDMAPALRRAWQAALRNGRQNASPVPAGLILPEPS